jgi:hypothetical protein
VTMLNPSGKPIWSWGPGRSGSLTSCLDATPCAMRVDDPPVFAPDGTAYILVWDAESGDAEIVALDRHGDVKPGWPQPARGLVAAGPDGRVYIVGNEGLYALMPDGTPAE